jgi:hypothetical protein
MIRFVPGLIGALASYVAMVLIDWINNGWIHTVIFFGVYLFVTVAVDKAMTRYRQNAG